MPKPRLYIRIEARPHQFGQVIETRILMGDSHENRRGVGVLALNPLQWMVFKRIMNRASGGIRLAALAHIEIMDGTDRAPHIVN